jgi:hypothetical protein
LPLNHFIRDEAALAIRYRRSGSALRQLKACHSTSVDYKAVFFVIRNCEPRCGNTTISELPLSISVLSTSKVLGMSLAHNTFQHEERR